MRRFLRALLWPIAACSGALAIFVVLTLPPRTLRLGASMPQTAVLGGYHIHTARSDGTGTVEQIAAAAARSGLSFLVFTDHGDGTRRPDPPAYVHGVLCIDAVEIGSDAGHLVALGLTAPAPYPLGGDPRDVIEDIHRLGGRAVLAHPDSPHASLSWRGMAGAFDGLEWMNVDSEWRDDRPPQLFGAAARSLLRAPEAVASLFSRPARTLQRWDAALRTRSVFGLAALDAHARIPWREADEPRRGTALAWPSYETMFRTLAQVAVLDAPLSGDAASDATRIGSALVGGQSFSLLRAYAGLAHLEFSAMQDGTEIPMGGRLSPAGGPVVFRAQVPEAPGARITLFEDGREVGSATGRLQVGPRPANGGAYRVEVTLPGFTAPWIVSNAIATDRVGAPVAPDADDPGAEQIGHSSSAEWDVERDPSSTGTVTRRGDEIDLAFVLGGGVPQGQYVAIVSRAGGDVGFDRVTFVARASRALRLSVQVRLPGGKDGQRWRRSVYVDDQPREIVVRLQDLSPVGMTTTRRPFVAPIQELLFVVDTVNTLPGTAATLTISKVAFGVGKTGG